MLAFAVEGFVGSARCAACHPAQSMSQAKSGHARSLYKAAEHPLLVAMLTPSSWILRPPHYRLRFQFRGGQLSIQAHDAAETMRVPVDWAFGAGDQAVTFVSRINPDWYLEHYFSYYPRLGRMAPTPGQEVLKAKSLPEAMGLPYETLNSVTGIRGCFECHSTGPVRVDRQTGLQPFEAGVGCESCHGPGRDHLAVATRESIANPKRLAADGVNELCGQCHRPPQAPGKAIDWNYAWNVRHQPMYLNQSLCEKKSEGKLSCFTCHEPHQPLQKSSAAYNRRCQTCHTSVHREEPQQNCIDCHMPRVSPQPGLRFTNHWIGIYGDGSKLKPRR